VLESRPQTASLGLIAQSAEQLAEFATLRYPNERILLPRPGCGNGGLAWEQVRPVLIDVLPDNVVVVTK
jgi:hypothetical protein